MPPKKSNLGQTKLKLIKKKSKLSKPIKKNKSDIENEIDFGIDSDLDDVGDVDDVDDVEDVEDVEDANRVDEIKQKIATKNYHPTKLKEKYEYHPEIHREIVFVVPESRITSEVMTKFEFTDIISQRAKQIESGSTVFTDTGDLTDPIKMAEKELRDKKCPLDIIRMITDKIAERWHANEMGVNWE